MAKVKINRADYDISALCNQLAEATKMPAGYTTEEIPGSDEEWFDFGDHDEAQVQAAIDLYIADTPAREAATTRAAIIAALAATDTGMVRTIEDILTALVVKGLFLKTDIPRAVLDKIAAREVLRRQLTNAA